MSPPQMLRHMFRLKCVSRSLANPGHTLNPEIWQKRGPTYGRNGPFSTYISHRWGAKAVYIAAKQGHLDAIYNMGVLTMLGRGVKQDTRTAYRYWAVAAEFAHAQAQLHTGRMLARGLGELISDIWGKRGATYGEKGVCRRIQKKGKMTCTVFPPIASKKRGKHGPHAHKVEVACSNLSTAHRIFVCRVLCPLQGCTRAARPRSST